VTVTVTNRTGFRVSYCLLRTIGDLDLDAIRDDARRHYSHPDFPATADV